MVETVNKITPIGKFKCLNLICGPVESRMLFPHREWAKQHVFRKLLYFFTSPPTRVRTVRVFEFTARKPAIKNIFETGKMHAPTRHIFLSLSFSAGRGRALIINPLFLRRAVWRQKKNRKRIYIMRS